MKKLLLVALWSCVPAIAQAPAVGPVQLLNWAVRLSGYPAPRGLPPIDTLSRAQLVDAYCAKRDIPEEECFVVGLYVPATGRVFVADFLTPDQYQRVMVHELTHYLQEINSPGLSECAKEYEAAHTEWAYRAIAQGYTGEFEFDREFYRCPSGSESSLWLARSSSVQ